MVPLGGNNFLYNMCIKTGGAYPYTWSVCEVTPHFFLASIPITYLLL